MKSLFLLLVVLATVFVGCNTNSADVDSKDSKTSEKVNTPTGQNQLVNNNPVTPVTPEKTGPQTTVELSKLKHDFGVIDEGDVINTTFMIKNTGKEPMIINDAKASCGCTVPEIQKNVPIAPGESTEVKVRFDSRNRGGKANKVVTIKGNFPDARFTVAGEVTPKAKPVAVNPAQ